jgi:Zn-dependent metalloprotease
MQPLDRFALTWTVFSVAFLLAGQDAAAQPPGAVSVTAGSGARLRALRQWDAAVDSMNRNRELVVTSRVEDRALPGRTHEYLAQVVDGVPLLGAGVARQLDAGGVTISLLGALHPGINMDTTPGLSAAEVAARLEQAQAGRLVASRRPALVVLPLPHGAYALAYRVAMSDGRYYFVDADDGRVLHVADAFLRQSTVGGGSDARGRRKKLGTTRDGARYQAHDRLRPAEVVTLDGRFDFLRIDRLLLGHFIDELPPGAPVWNANDVAADSDNEWEDPAVVEAHVHTGWTYDYLYARHGWRGLDGADGRIFSIVNVDFGGPDAIAAPPPFGPEGAGVYVYGRVSDGMREEPLSSLDVVAHELMHGVTHFAVSRRTGDPAGLVGGFPSNTRLGPESVTDDRGRAFTCDPDFFWCVDGRFLLGSNETGAVNEAYSDIVGESVGFFHEDNGATADYLQGGDHAFGPIRSLADPGSLSVVGGVHRPYPDAYAGRYEFALARALMTTNPEGSGFRGADTMLWDYTGLVFVDGRFVFALGAAGYGGEHWNSTILSHAFYLAVEGGANRTTGLTVAGVGNAGRGEVERIFFRALTDLMPQAATLPLAAAAIRQAAADLDPGGAARRAVEQALLAVGLPPA